ncbi:unnamed protein product [Gongylonema pulchrum]|uniref:UCH domain-containing protein n=1 Tax=Gongylonema pulchrum TaxID=637853 RepID=A0A183D072_9BILA|nr:unnamed protein product [Gongylonema pulchrum]
MFQKKPLLESMGETLETELTKEMASSANAFMVFMNLLRMMKTGVNVLPRSTGANHRYAALQAMLQVARTTRESTSDN